MNDLKALYQEVILDHSKHPRHFHALEPCDHSATGHNPLCGDNLKVYVRMDGDQLADISFVGDGRARHPARPAGPSGSGTSWRPGHNN